VPRWAFSTSSSPPGIARIAAPADDVGGRRSAAETPRAFAAFIRSSTDHVTFPCNFRFRVAGLMPICFLSLSLAILLRHWMMWTCSPTY